MSQNRNKFFLRIFFVSVSIIFLTFFILNITTNLDTELQSGDKDVFYSSNLIEDEIAPFCNGIEYTNYKNINYSHIDINFNDREKWFENIFSVSLETQRAIKPKYKKSFDGFVNAYYTENQFCSFPAEIRISGDWNDHIDDESLIASMDVKLNEGNIYGITRFKLFLPETKNSDNEIITTTILDELGILTPRTFYIYVGMKTFSNLYFQSKYIFQEKPLKEMIEFNQLREGPIYETNEEFKWKLILNGMNKAPEGKRILMLSKILNDSWSTRGLANLNITLQGLEKYNKAIFNSYNSESRLNYKFLGINVTNFQIFDAAIIATLSEHALTTHNRKFFYNVLEDQFYPIYYDGNSNLIELGHLRGYADYKDWDYFGLATGAEEILNSPRINKNEFNRILNSKGLAINLETSNKIIDRFYNNLENIKNFETDQKITYNNFFENAEKIIFEDNFKFIFYDIKNKNLEVCNFNLTNCETNITNLSYEELLKNKIELTNNSSGYLIGEKKDNFINTDITKVRTTYFIDQIKLEVFGNPNIQINESTREVIIFLNSTSEKVKFQGPGEISNWKINITSNINLESQDSRIDENLLTGCLTLFNLNVNNLEINSDSMFCEDAVNFINVTGNNIFLNLINSSFDAFDADFSNLKFTDVKIFDAGNDCIDFSSGVYEIENLNVEKCLDKGISIGERSKLKIKFSKILRSYIGVAVKDSSEARFNSIELENVELCFAAYRKKQEFGPSYIYVNDFKCPSNSINFIQTGSIFDAGN